MSIKVETTINIEVGQGDDTLVLVLTLDEARALKDELIRAVGAQNPLPGYAPVLSPVGGFVSSSETGPRNIPDHLLKRAQAARDKNKPRCHCGDPGWGDNGCCGPSGCSNVPA